MWKNLNKMNKLMLLILLAFIIWMLFFDENSFLTHREINKEIDKLESTTKYYKEEIDNDKKMIDDLNDPESLEKFAREKYKMKRENEEIFIIEFDTLKGKRKKNKD